MSKRFSRQAVTDSSQRSSHKPSRRETAAPSTHHNAGYSRQFGESTMTRAASNWSWLLPVVIVFLGLGAYLNSLSGAFVFDDDHYLQNVEAQSNRGTLWSWAISNRRAVMDLSFAANYAWGGEDVVGYHLVNIAVHLCAAMALFGLIHRTLRTDRLREQWGEKAKWIAFVVSAIWVVHPLNTQAVTYIVQRGEAIMAMFFLLSLYCISRSLQSSRSVAWSLGAVVACLLSVMTKEVAATLPLIIVFYDYFFGKWTLAEQWRKRGWLYLLLFATLAWYPAAGLGELTGTAQDASAGLFYEALTPWQYALTQPLVILKYLRLSVWPHPLSLDHFQPAQHTRFDLDQPAWLSAMQVALPVVILIIPVVMTIWGLVKRQPLAFAGVLFFGVLSVTSSIIPIADLMVEHRMYLPLTAVITVGVMGAYLAMRKWMPVALIPVLATILTVAVTGSLMARTIVRNEDYRHPTTIWAAVVEHAPHNPRGWHNLASAYDELCNQVDDPAQKEEYEKSAFYCWEQVLQLAPTYAAAHNGIGVIYYRQGDLKRAEELTRKAVELEPNQAMFYNDLGKVLYAKQQYAEAQGMFEKAIAMRERYEEAYNDLGLVLVKQGRVPQARRAFEKAIEYKPDFIEAYVNLGTLEMNEENFAAAKEAYQRLIDMSPESEQGYRLLGSAHVLQGELAQAERLFDTALAKQPDNRDFVLIYTHLAYRYAQQDFYPQAVAVIRKAIAHANRLDMPPQLTAELNEYLRLYQQRKRPQLPEG